MASAVSNWWAEAAAVLVKDLRAEWRARASFASVVLFAASSLVVVALAVGPRAADQPDRGTLLSALLWVILLYAAAAGVPRAFVHEEEAGTATVLRLAGTPSAIYAGKLAFSTLVLGAVTLLITPVFLAIFDLPVEAPGRLAAALAAGGLGLAAASTLIASVVATARVPGPLFAVLAFPVLVPVLLLAVGATSAAILGQPAGPVFAQLLLYDAASVVAGLMLFPALWNP